MKKICKILAFTVVFALIFTFLQHTFHYKFKQYSHNVIKYSNLDAVDVVFIGTSELWLGVSPMEIYGETGITSFNLSHAYKSAPTFCREVEYVLQTKKPKYIALDFSSLYSDENPQNEETVFGTVLYGIPSPLVKVHLLADIWKLDKKDFFSYAFPLLRYHDMWRTKEYNIGPEYNDEDVKIDYMLGWNTYEDAETEPSPENQARREIKKKLWNTTERVEEIPKMNREYFDKIITMCKENGVQIIAICPPRYNDAKIRTAQWDTTKKYFEDNDIIVFNYNTYESAIELGLDWNEDFYNEGHLNYKGAIKWSRKIAQDFKSKGIESSSGENIELDNMYDAFYMEYKDHYKQLGVTFE